MDTVVEPTSRRPRSPLGGGGPTVVAADDSPTGDLSVGLGALVNLRSLNLGHNLFDGTKHPQTARALHLPLMCSLLKAVLLLMHF